MILMDLGSQHFSELLFDHLAHDAVLKNGWNRTELGNIFQTWYGFQLTKVIWEKGTKNAYFQNEVIVILDIEVASINSIR